MAYNETNPFWEIMKSFNYGKCFCFVVKIEGFFFFITLQGEHTGHGSLVIFKCFSSDTLSVSFSSGTNSLHIEMKDKILVVQMYN